MSVRAGFESRIAFINWVLLILICFGCNAKINMLSSLNQELTPNALTLTPGTHSLAVGGTLNLSASGGNPPYTYSIDSGGGSIDSSTGVYTAPGGLGAVVIKVVDSLSQEAFSNITLVTALSTTRTNFMHSNGAGVAAPLKTIVSGGVPPYTYTLDSGPGSLDATTGIYTQPSVGGTALISISDSFGNPLNLQVTVSPQITNGTINSYASNGSDLYFVGSFNAIHPQSFDAGFLEFNPTTKSPAASGCFLRSHVTGTISFVTYAGSDIYLGGSFTEINGVTVQNLAKMNATTCLVDTNFSQSPGLVGTITAMHFFSGSLYIGGQISSYRSSSTQGLIKVDGSSGALDSTFSQNPGLGFSGMGSLHVYAIVDDGTSIYVGGVFNRYRGTVIQNILKLSTSGTLDPTFTSATGFNTLVWSLAVAHNSLYVGGGFTSYRGSSQNYLARLNLTDGSVISAFNAGGSPDNFIRKLIVSGNDVYAIGAFTTYRSQNARYLMKIDFDDGDLNTTFIDTGSNTFELNQLPSDLEISGNSVYVFGSSIAAYRGVSSGNFLKLDSSNGSLASDYSNFIILTTSLFGISMKLLSNQNFLILAPYFGGEKVGNLAKINANTLQLDSVFTDSNGLLSGSMSLIRYGNSSFYILTPMGSNSYRGSLFTGNIIKIDPNTGARDLGFVSPCNGQMFDAVVNSGFVYYSTISGWASCDGGSTNTGPIVKLDWTTGIWDSVFSPSSDLVTGGTVRNLEHDGTYLYFSTVWANLFRGGVSPISRLNGTTGVLDSSFSSTGSGIGDAATHGMLFLNNNLFSAHLNCVPIKGSPNCSWLSKVDTTGNLDTSFTRFPGLNERALILAGDASSVYAYGSFTNYDGSPVGTIIKIDSTTGVLDTNFLSPILFLSIPETKEMVVSGNYLFLGTKGVRVNKTTGAIE
jgi:hypothetical protein